MTFRNTLKKYLSNHAETAEEHWDDSLKTHYYKTTKDKVIQYLESLFKNSPEFEINSISKDRGEMSVITKKGKKVFIVITVIMVSPNRTAVDFSTTMESVFPIDFGYCSKLINRLYGKLNKEYPLVNK